MPLPADQLVVALDCGTSSTKAIAVNYAGRVVARGSAPLALLTPRPGWVEQDPGEVIESAMIALEELLAQVDASSVAAVGISNQRESLVLWDRTSGEPLSPLLSWQDRRTRSIIQELDAAGHGEAVYRISGLPLDPMFSAVKATWLLETYDPDRARARSGDLAIGTVDSWIAWNLTGRHVTDPGNASRMSLVDLASGQWSEELLGIFRVPRACLAEIGPSARDDLTIAGGALAGTPLAALVGDSHAALFSHRGWVPGTAKATLGTGSSVMVTAPEATKNPGLCRTIGWQLAGDDPTVALEANILAAGATLVWLAEVLGASPAELAGEAAPTTDVVFVPAFDGLGAPYWDDAAVATISQLSLSTERGDLVRAALDSVAMQIADVLDAFADAAVNVETLIVDGGMTENTSLMQSLADAIGIPVQVADAPDASALGAANLAGLGIGALSIEDLDRRTSSYRSIRPTKSREQQQARREAWKIAVRQARENGYDRSGQ